LISVFISYSHKDEDLRNQLETHLTTLKREGVIDVWHDRRIAPGDEFERAINRALEEAQVILLLVSADFLASEYCYSKEMLRAVERHDAGEAKVLPVILRPCDWHRAPFGKLLATPTDGKPVKKWPDIDEAFLHVVQDVRRAIETIAPRRATVPRTTARNRPGEEKSAATRNGPRSSNLRIRKTFTEADKDRFMDEAFEYIANFFENSLRELQDRNAGIQTAFKRLDAHRFTAVVYRGGKAESRCRIALGGSQSMSGSITYAMTDSPSDTSFNESVSVEEGEQMLFLKPLGMQAWRGGQEKEQLTFEGAAEYFWSIFIEPLQH